MVEVREQAHYVDERRDLDPLQLVRLLQRLIPFGAHAVRMVPSQFFALGDQQKKTRNSPDLVSPNGILHRFVLHIPGLGRYRGWSRCVVGTLENRVSDVFLILPPSTSQSSGLVAPPVDRVPSHTGVLLVPTRRAARLADPIHNTAEKRWQREPVPLLQRGRRTRERRLPPQTGDRTERAICPGMLGVRPLARFVKCSAEPTLRPLTVLDARRILSEPSASEGTGADDGETRSRRWGQSDAGGSSRTPGS